jgi:DNA mismatch repair protein MSH6
VVHRELTQVLTRGTLDEDGVEERVLMCLTKNIVSVNAEEYGVAMLERQTNTISLAKIDNRDMSYHDLKTLITQTNPVEVVIDGSNIPKHDPIVKIFQAA